MIGEWIKHQVIGSPFHRPAEIMRELAVMSKRFRHPELRDIFLESSRSRSVIARSVTAEMNCLDVGCHLGSVLSEFLRHAPGGRHVAVEPLPYKAAWLRKKFPRTQIVEAAISESEGEVEFTWNKSRTGYSSLASEGLDGDRVERLRVQARALDDIVATGHRIGFMKVDVEGAELMAFRSARRILTEDRPTVLFECAHRSTNALGFEVDDVFHVLSDEYGYSIMYLQEYLEGRRSLDIDSFKQSMSYPFKAFNFVAVPSS